MKKTLTIVALMAAAFMALTACGKKGPKYEILFKGEGRAVQMGDIIEGTLCLWSNDSVLFRFDEPDKFWQVVDPVFPGDLNEALLKMHEGDSVNIYMPVDSMAKYTGGGLPPFVKDYLVYSIRIDRLWTEEELQQADMIAEANATEAQNEAIKQYLEENKLEMDREDNGLYIKILKKGQGETPKAGQMVRVNYVGKLLNGKMFDTNLEDVAKENDLYNPMRPYEPMEFAVGVGQMIPGFDQACMKLSKGAKALVIIPFELAYGPRAVSENIQAFSTLTFEIEMVDFN